MDTDPRTPLRTPAKGPPSTPSPIKRLQNAVDAAVNKDPFRWHHYFEDVLLPDLGLLTQEVGCMFLIGPYNSEVPIVKQVIEQCLERMTSMAEYYFHTYLQSLGELSDAAHISPLPDNIKVVYDQIQSYLPPKHTHLLFRQSHTGLIVFEVCLLMVYGWLNRSAANESSVSSGGNLPTSPMRKNATSHLVSTLLFRLTKILSEWIHFGKYVTSEIPLRTFYGWMPKMNYIRDLARQMNQHLLETFPGGIHGFDTNNLTATVSLILDHILIPNQLVMPGTYQLPASEYHVTIFTHADYKDYVWDPVEMLVLHVHTLLVQIRRLLLSGTIMVPANSSSSLANWVEVKFTNDQKTELYVTARHLENIGTIAEKFKGYMTYRRAIKEDEPNLLPNGEEEEEVNETEGGTETMDADEPQEEEEEAEDQGDEDDQMSHLVYASVAPKTPAMLSWPIVTSVGKIVGKTRVENKTNL